MGDGRLAAALTSPARLALSGKLMGYAALGAAHPALVAEVRRELEGCPISGVMMNANGQLDGQERCLAAYGVAHGPGGQAFLDTPGVVARAARASQDPYDPYDSGSVPASGSSGGGGGGGGEDSSGDGGGGVAGGIDPLDIDPLGGGVAGGALVTRRAQRDVAASAQLVMEEEVIAMVAEALAGIEPGHGTGRGDSPAARPHAGAGLAVDGLVLVGGCALNVRVNSRLAAAFPHLPVHVPAAPSDCGLAVRG